MATKVRFALDEHCARCEAKLLLNNKHAEMEAYLRAYCEQVYCGADLTRSKQLAIVVALFDIREGRSSNAQCKLSDVVLPAFINAMVTGSMRGSRAIKLAYWWTGYGTAERATACAQGDATKPQGEYGLVNNAKQRRLGSAIKCAYCNTNYWDKVADTTAVLLAATQEHDEEQAALCV